MRTIISFLFISLVLAGCGLVDSNPSKSASINASFKLTDTSGNVSDTFSSGKTFDMHFSLVNTTGHAITYNYDGAPPVHFQILKNDSIVAASEYSEPNIKINFPDTLKPGDTIQVMWEAQNYLRATLNASLILPAGSYQAKVIYPSFNNVKINCTSVIEFSISSSITNNNLSFVLTDTTGYPKSIFSRGEQFNLSFAYINTTADVMTYVKGSSAPSVIFEILKNDSVVASSVDGMGFAQVLIGGSLAPNDTLMGQWRAPNTPYQFPKVILSPGSYKARALYPTFGQAAASSHLDIPFSVVQ